MNQSVSDYMAAIGKRGGIKTTAAKRSAAKRNLVLARKIRKKSAKNH